MRAAVFIKQVPDVRLGSVATRPDGTIDRSSAPAITNPVDLHALEAALETADHVVAITMGPPAAEATARDALTHGADAAVLISDRAFAGSDTWATANVLAAAIEVLGPFNVIMCGTSALDGETGQVGPQVAERLAIPHVTGCEAIRTRPDAVVVRRIVEGGYQTVAVAPPVLISVAETGYPPSYPKLAQRQHARSATIRVLGQGELGLEDDRAGLEASPTKVAHMEQVPLASVDTQFVGTDLTFEALAAELARRGALSPPSAEHAPDVSDLHEALPKASDPRAPVVWVVCELTEGHLAAVSAELLTESRHLAEQLGGSVAAFVAGSGVEHGVAQAGMFGADVVFVADHPELEPYRSLPHTRVLSDALRTHRPEVVLMGATSTGRDLAPRVAARLDTGLAADCTGLHIADWSRRGLTYENLLHQVRPAMGASVLATCISPSARPQMATVRPGVFGAVRDARKARIVKVPVLLSQSDRAVTVVENNVHRRDVSLADASVIVAGGAGCTADRWHLVEDLAAALGGSVGASRGAVEAGLAPRALQIGQTGATVRPELYVACGLSGAFQHVVGIRGARTVLAINRDEDAPIFRVAHFGIIGDVADVLPELTSALAAQAAPV